MSTLPRLAAPLSLVAALLLSPAVAAQALATTKIVTIRAAEVVQASPQFKAGQAQMKAEFDRRKADLEAEAKKLAEDVRKFQKEADLLGVDARAKAEKDLTTRRIDFESKQRQFGEDFQKRDREMTEAMMAKIKEVVVAVAKEKGADLVLQDPVYAAPGSDITNDVLARLAAAK